MLLIAIVKSLILILSSRIFGALYLSKVKKASIEIKLNGIMKQVILMKVSIRFPCVPTIECKFISK
jgi:hypothetical protein